MIAIGQNLPAGEFTFITAEGKQLRDGQTLFAGKKVVLFAVPGAFTPTCSNAHLPGYVVLADQFKAKGVDEVICLSVNDPFVMKAWGDSTGGAAAGISFLADGDASFTKAVGMDFTVPAIGFHDRSKRYALQAVNGVVKVLHAEENAGQCDISGGEAMLAAI